LERAIENDPTLAMAYFVLASAHNDMGRFQEARQAVDRGLLLNPNAWQAYYEGARADAANGDFDSALRELSKAETLVPPDNVHLVLFNRAKVLAHTGHGEEAATVLKSYISKNPSGPYTARARELLDQVSHYLNR
jgi:tetratricopeptide (TPR) repeat protein